MSKKKSCVPVYCLRARKTPSSKLPHLLIYVMVKCSEVELSNLLATYELYNVKKPQRRLRVFDTLKFSNTCRRKLFPKTLFNNYLKSRSRDVS